MLRSSKSFLSRMSGLLRWLDSPSGRGFQWIVTTALAVTALALGVDRA